MTSVLKSFEQFYVSSQRPPLHLKKLHSVDGYIWDNQRTFAAGMQSIASMPNLNGYVDSELEIDASQIIGGKQFSKSPVAINSVWTSSLGYESNLHEADAASARVENSASSTVVQRSISPRPTSFEAPARLESPHRNIQPRRRSHSIDCGSAVKSFCLLESNREDVLTSDLPGLVARADTGLKCLVPPLLAEGAMGGSYFLRDRNRSIVLVFKPSDEEPHAPNNPYQLSGSYGAAYKGRIVPGFGMYREVAAHILDVDGFAGVPPTEIVKVRHPVFDKNPKEDVIGAKTPYGYKLGSVQSYVRSECSADEMGPSKFDFGDIQRIALFDIRLCNLDRHAGNILVSKSAPYRMRSDHHVSSPPSSPGKTRNVRFDFDHSDETEEDGAFNLLSSSAPASTGQHWAALAKRFDGDDSQPSSPAVASESYRLVPIDHGYCLPHVLHLSDVHFCWIDWPQVKEQLLPEVRMYIMQLDVEKDIASLQQAVGAAIPETSLLTLRVCTMLLQRGVEQGLSLYEVGKCLVPDSDECGFEATSKAISPQSDLQRCVNTAVQRTAHRELQRALGQTGQSPSFRFHSEQAQNQAVTGDETSELTPRSRFQIMSKVSSAAVVIATLNAAEAEAKAHDSKSSLPYVSDEMLRFSMGIANGTVLNAELINAVDELIRHVLSNR